MKALSIVAPGGALIASGQKRLEIRRWRPALAAGDDLLIIENHRFLRAEGEVDPEGRAVALVKLGPLRPFRPEDIAAACANSYEPGWLAWELLDIRPVSAAGPLLAARGIYEIEPGELRPVG